VTARTPCPNGACAANEYCAHTPALCGKGHAVGLCRPRTEACTPHVPVCGCNGKVYPDDCAAHASGVDLSELGGCSEPVPDFIPCGQRYCDSRESYCEIYLSDVLEPPTTHVCRSLPPACKAGASDRLDCGCFPPGTPCASFCGTMWTGGLPGFHLTCQGVQSPVVVPHATTGRPPG